MICWGQSANLHFVLYDILFIAHDDPAPVSTSACVGIVPFIIIFIMLLILFKGFFVKLLNQVSAVPTFVMLTGRSRHARDVGTVASHREAR